MKDKIVEVLLFTGLSKEEIIALIEIPPSPELGDYSFPCFALSKKYKKNPADISLELKQKIKSSFFEKIESKGPYLNFFLDRKKMAESTLKEILTKKNKYGSSDIGQNKKIVLDYSAPNVGKPMHVGHIRSTLIGASLEKIYNFLGYKTITLNYLGDIGLHIGKLIVAYELWLDKTALKKDPIGELLRLYVKFNENENLNFEEKEDYEGNEWTLKAKEKLKLIEEGDKKMIKIWEKIIDSSIEGFNKVYSMLDVKFNETTGQSKFSEKGKEIILNAFKKGLVAREKDSSAFYIELDNLPKKYLLRSNGTASYITQDIGAAVWRKQKYKFHEMIYVTDYRQKLHFQQLFATLLKLGYNYDCKHLPFGTVNFGNEILATREGKIILLEDVLDKAVEKASQEIKKRNSKADAKSIGISAVKYIILKNEPSKDVSFTWENSLSFEGNTGPYLLYTYARAKSILKKSKSKSNLKIKELSDKEKDIIFSLKNFPEIVKSAHKQLSPNIIANYAFEISQKFNEFYHSEKVIGSENETFRLQLVESFSQTLRNALNLLGISVIEKM